MKYHHNDSNNDLNKGSHPIPSKKIFNFLKKLKISLNKSLFDYDSLERYKNNYLNWIKSDKLNHLKNIQKFPHVCYSSGTSESMINFVLKYKDRTIKTFKGEFVFHKLNCRNNDIKFSYLDDNLKLNSNDAVIISLPFSDIGDIHPLMNSLIQKCNIMKIPVLIDCAYMCISKNINFDFDQECIDTITFSLSKGFWGIDKLRLGLRLQRKDYDDNLDIYNKWSTIPLHSLHVANEIFRNFDVNWLWTTYREKYFSVCKKYNLTPTNSILHALGGIEYAEYNRGGDVNRVCIANSLKDYD